MRLALLATLLALATPALADEPPVRAVSDEQCRARSAAMVEAMRAAAARGRRVIYDPKGFWKCTNANLNRLARHITLEEFRSKDPVRSGREVELYRRIKEFAVKRKPGEVLDMQRLLEMGLDAAAADDGSVNVQLALLTIHNVVRILARPKVWPEVPSPKDPAAPMFLDLLGAAGLGGKPLPALLGVRPNPVNPGDWTLDTLFDVKGGAFEVQPGAEANTEWNGGCHYYFWIGALSRTTMGAAAIMAGVVGEGLGKKGNAPGLTPVDQKINELLAETSPQGKVEISSFVCGAGFGSAAFAARAQFPGSSPCPGDKLGGDTLVLIERDFETHDPATKTLKPGRNGSTPTSQWAVSDGLFQFASQKDGFHLKVTWDAPPLHLEANDPFVMTVTAEIKGDRKAEVALTPVMAMDVWRVTKRDGSEGVAHPGPNAYRLTVDGTRRKGHMQLEVAAVGVGAKIVNGEVVGGSGKLYRGKKPDQYDAYFLELQLNGMAVARWTYVPVGSPLMK